MKIQRSFAITFVGLLLSLAGLGPAASASSQAASVKETYGALGPHQIVEDHVIDSEGADAILMYPADLDQGPFPVIVWGNGSDASPAEYQGLLEHFASWGFVVIASTNQQVGTGEEMMATIDHLEVMNADPDDPLFGAVDLEWIGVSGHSQGAGGSAMAAERDSRLDAVATVALPQEPFAFEPEKQYDVDNISLPILLFGGSLDPISPNTTNMDYFNRVQGPAATAMLTTASHNDVQGDGAAFRPYLTAWFRYLLADDVGASAAFTGDAPELADDLDFNSVAFRDLPAAGEHSNAPTPAEQPAPVSEPAPPPIFQEVPPTASSTATSRPSAGAAQPVARAPVEPPRAPEVAPPPTGEVPRPAGPSADLTLPAAVDEVDDVIDLPALAVVIVVLGAAVQGLVPRRRRASLA